MIERCAMLTLRRLQNVSSHHFRMVRGLKVSSEFKLEAVSAPGTTLASPGHVFIEIQIFKQIVRSEYCYPLFPILLHSKLR